MVIKIVDRPLQDEHTKPEDIQYPGHHWCVFESRYMNMDQFFDEIKHKEKKSLKYIESLNITNKRYEIFLYLYSITPQNEGLAEYLNENGDKIQSKTDIVFYIRHCYKIVEING